MADTTRPRGALLPTPAFAAPVNNPYGLTAGGNYTNASFVDIDGDGDLDAFLGDQSGNPRFFSNTGSASAPAFAAVQVNPFGLTYIDSVDSPSFVDIDGDGDLDGIFGVRGGDIWLARNTGTVNSPAFAPKTSKPLGLTNVGPAFAMPTLVDIDGDGDLDIFSGNRDGNTVVQLNTGTKTAPAFGLAATNPYGLSNVIEQANPNFADLDGDGDLDLFIGQVQGNTLYFQNTGTTSTPAFAAPVTNPFSIANVGAFASASFVDIDNDGDLDVFLGERTGATVFQLNNGNPVAPVNSATLDGSYRATSVITLTLAFNEAVIVTGNPTLLLETGVTDRVPRSRVARAPTP